VKAFSRGSVQLTNRSGARAAGRVVRCRALQGRVLHNAKAFQDSGKGVRREAINIAGCLHTVKKHRRAVGTGRPGHQGGPAPLCALCNRAHYVLRRLGRAPGQLAIHLARQLLHQRSRFARAQSALFDEHRPDHYPLASLSPNADAPWLRVRCYSPSRGRIHRKSCGIIMLCPSVRGSCGRLTRLSERC
jgi:hypothetical protein